eukprot:Sspe_Gene.49693::Locus_26996_Transcript_1_1_Confidence_1.000_Length_1013::g.49693::m.49693
MTTQYPTTTTATMDTQEPPLGAVSGMWRSEDMELRTMVIERSVLEKVVRELGELGAAQFRDLNSRGDDGGMRKRCFINQVRTCENIERHLRFFEEQLRDHRVPISNFEDDPELPLGVEDFRGNRHFRDLPNALELLSRKLEADERELRDQCEKLSRYTNEHQTAIERREVVMWAEKWSMSHQEPLDRPEEGTGDARQ